MIKNKVIVCTVIVSMLCSNNIVSAKQGNITLKTKSINTTVGATKTIKFKQKKGVKIISKKFISTNKKVASVSKRGKVTAKSAGKCTIKVNLKYKCKKKNKKVNFKVPVKVTEKNIVTPSPVDGQSSNTVTQNSTNVLSNNGVSDSGATVTPSSTPSVINVTDEQKQKYNENDIKAITNILNEQIKLGADVETDIFDGVKYYWRESENGGKYRLVNIDLSEDSDTHLKGSIDFSGLDALEDITLSCEKDITDINISGNLKLESLKADGCNGISKLNLSNNTELRTLDLSSDNNIIGIDTSNNSKLSELNLNNTGVSELNLGNNEELYYLSVENTNITELDVSSNYELSKLNCGIYNSKLSSLDLSNNIWLTELTIPYNLNVSLDSNKSITSLKCGVNLSIDCLKDNLERLYLYDSIENYKERTHDMDLNSFTKLCSIEVNYCSINSLKLNSSYVVGLSFKNCKLQSENVFNEILGVNSLCRLYIEGTSITEDINFEKLQKLNSLTLYCCDGVKNIDLTNNSELNYLYLDNDNTLENITLGQKDNLIGIVLGTNKNLQELDVSGVTRSDFYVDDYSGVVKIIR